MKASHHRMVREWLEDPSPEATRALYRVATRTGVVEALRDTATVCAELRDYGSWTKGVYVLPFGHSYTIGRTETIRERYMHGDEKRTYYVLFFSMDHDNSRRYIGRISPIDSRRRARLKKAAYIHPLERLLEQAAKHYQENGEPIIQYLTLLSVFDKARLKEERKRASHG